MSKRKADDAPTDDSPAKKSATGGAGDVQALLNKREEARKAKDWTTADALREDLRALGVQLHDKEGVWKDADGKAAMYPGDKKLSDDGIKMMLNAREEARKAKDFEQADAIREDLRERGLQIFDKDKKWTSDSGRSGYFGGKQAPMYGMPPQFAFGGPPMMAAPPSSEADILYVIAQREMARQTSDWGTADRLRDTLRAAGVNVSDKDHTWTAADGRSGTIDRNSAAAIVAARQAVAYSGHPQIQMAQSQMYGQPQQMAQMYGQPQQMAPSQVYGAPAAYGAAAPAAYGAAAYGGAAAAPLAVAGGTLNDQQIQAMISQRESARRLKDYATGDQIRDQLRMYSVEMDDKAKTWTTTDGRTGTY